MSKKISLGAGIALAAVASAITVSLTYVYAMNHFNEKMADVNERQAMYTKLSEIDQTVRQDYVGTIDEETLTDAICAGYVAGLGDAGAKYYSAERYQEYQAGPVRQRGRRGHHNGAGRGRQHGDRGRPSRLRGREGRSENRRRDCLSLDGKEIVRLTYGEAVNKLDGQAGTTVTLSVLRPAAEEGGTAEQITFTITRAEYVQRSITSATINGNVGYLAVSQFREGADNQFNNELSSLLKSGVAGLVIDLRNNPGGDMESMANMLDVLLPAGAMVSSRDSAGNITVEYTSSANEIGVPISVIVNGSTYGAAEPFRRQHPGLQEGSCRRRADGGPRRKAGDPPTLGRLRGDAVRRRVSAAGRLRFSGTGVTPDVEKSLDEEQAELLVRRQLELSDDAQVQAAVTALVQQGAAVAEQPGGETVTPAQEAASSAPSASSAEDEPVSSEGA